MGPNPLAPGLADGTAPQSLVVSIPVPIPSPHNETANPVSQNTGATTTVYVGVPLGALSLWVLAFYCCLKRRRRARPLLPISRPHLTDTVQVADDFQLDNLPPRADTVAASSSIDVPNSGRRPDTVEMPSSIEAPNVGPRPGAVGVASGVELPDVTDQSIAEVPSGNRGPRVRFSTDVDDVRVFDQHPGDDPGDDELEGQSQNNDGDGANEIPDDIDHPPGDDTVVGAMAQLDLGRRLGHRRNGVNGVDAYHSFELDSSTYKVHSLKRTRQRQQAFAYVRRMLVRMCRRREAAAGPTTGGSSTRPSFAGNQLYPSSASFYQWDMANANHRYHNQFARHARALHAGRRLGHRRNAVNTHTNFRMLTSELRAAAARNITVPAPTAALSSAGPSVGGDHLYPSSMSFSGWDTADAFKSPLESVARGAQAGRFSAVPSNQVSSSVPTSSMVRAFAHPVTNPLAHGAPTETPGADAALDRTISDDGCLGETETEAEYEYDETLYGPN